MKSLGSMLLVLVIVGAVSGCGDAKARDSGRIDAGAIDGEVTDAATTWEVVPPAPPASARAPICPESWTQPDSCAPPSEPPSCAARTFALPGSTRCERVGPACPEGDAFPEVSGPALYVRPGSGGDAADGSRSRPFGTLADAAAEAVSGTTIVLSQGEFPSGISLRAGVGLLGSCASTVILGDDDPTLGAVEFLGTDTFARNLTIRAEQQTGATSFGGEGLLDGVSIESPLNRGVFVNGGTLRLRNVRIDKPGLRAALVIGGTLELDGVEITGASGPQLHAQGGAASLRRVLVREPRPDPQGNAFGLFAAEGAVVEVEELTIVDALGSGIIGVDVGTVIRARQVSVTGTRIVNASDALGTGSGAYVGDGAQLIIEGGWFEGNGWGALQASGGTIVASDTWIRESVNGVGAGAQGNVRIERAIVRADETGLFSDGGDLDVVDAAISDSGREDQGIAALLVRNEGRLRAARIEVRGFRGYGLINKGGHSVLEDASFEGIRPLRSEDEMAANAIVFDEAESAELRRIRIDVLEGVGIVVLASTALLEDVDIYQTRWSNLTGGRAAALFDSTVTASRIRVTDPAGWAIDMYAGSALTLRDFDVSTTSPGPFGFGVGLHAREGSRADIERASITNSMGVAMWAEGPETSIRARELSIQSVLARMCSMPVCESEPAGIGVSAYDGATIDLSEFEVRNAYLCGVQIGPGSEVDLREGEIAGSTVGACVHEPEYSLARLTDRVVFDDNGISIETVSLPIPMAPELPRPDP